MVRLALISLLVSSVALADRVATPTAGAPMPQSEQTIMPPMPPRPPPQPIAVAPDIATQGKLLAGTYACKGNRQLGNGASTPLQSSLVVKLELDNAWIAGTWTEKGNKLVDYRTFDAVAKQWTRMQLVSDGSHAVLTSIGEKAGEWVWEGVASSPRGSVTVRHHETLKGKQLKVWGEAQLGGTWQKSYEATCKR
ncbi:MAG: hypothetical protein ABI591_30465 [Kofleriaceae bacterium]